MGLKTHEIITLFNIMDAKIHNIYGEKETKRILSKHYSRSDFFLVFVLFVSYYILANVADCVSHDSVLSFTDLAFNLIYLHFVLAISWIVMIQRALYKKQKFMNQILQNLNITEQKLHQNPRKMLNLFNTLWKNCYKIHKMLVNIYGPVLLVRLCGMYMSLVFNGYFVVLKPVPNGSAIYFWGGTLWTLWIITYHAEKNTTEVNINKFISTHTGNNNKHN